MSTFVQFVLLGLSAGALYVLAALGLIIICRAARVVNFAQGALAMVGGYTFWELRDRHGWSWLLAMVAAVLLTAALGVVIHYAVMRRLRKASDLTRLMATLAILAVLQSAASLLYTQPLTVVKPFLPHATQKVLGAPIGTDRLIIVGLVLVLVAALWFIYKHTWFGAATTAVSEMKTERPRSGCRRA